MRVDGIVVSYGFNGLGGGAVLRVRQVLPRRRVDKSDRKTLDYIYQASYMDYSYSDGALFAEASDIGRMFRPHPLRRFMRRVR